MRVMEEGKVKEEGRGGRGETDGERGWGRKGEKHRWRGREGSGISDFTFSLSNIHNCRFPALLSPRVDHLRVEGRERFQKR